MSTDVADLVSSKPSPREQQLKNIVRGFAKSPALLEYNLRPPVFCTSESVNSAHIHMDGGPINDAGGPKT